MTDQPSTATPTAAATVPTPMQAKAEARMLRAEIGNKWGKFTQQELADLKDNNDLVNKLVTKYGLDRAAASRDAAALVKGRAF
jgi:hypothetical protein